MGVQMEVTRPALNSGAENWPHIWCSRDHRRIKPDECDMCKRFFELYPMDECADDIELAAKHFPNAVPRT